MMKSEAETIVCFIAIEELVVRFFSDPSRSKAIADYGKIVGKIKNNSS